MWTQVSSNKKKKSKKFQVTGSSRPRFVFCNKKNTKNNDNQEFPPINQKTGNTQGNKKTQISWSLHVQQGPPKKTKNEKNTIYLYDSEVDNLVKTMNWGDFDLMMDDVEIVPEGQPKPH
tara:strand:- start:282 stop:638 length:357 start_codon:yes stop_codon:yes gene_type:complete